MQIICHRRNTIEQLRKTPTRYGVEIDLRSYQDDIILEHDPFKPGVQFESWLQTFQHQTLIVNIKEEGLESRIFELLQRYHIEDYFLLDQSFPFFIKYARQGHQRSALRVSEYESIQTAILCAKYATWIWLDCFTHFPIDAKQAQILKELGYKLCAVSPELQGFEPQIGIPTLRQKLVKECIVLDAVCTKHPELWEEMVR